MGKSKRHNGETPSERWVRTLKRMLRAELRASTLSLLIILAWAIFLIKSWQGDSGLFGG